MSTGQSQLDREDIYGSDFILNDRMSINFYLNWEEYFAAQEFFRRNQGAPAPELFRGGALIVLGLVLYLTGDLARMAGVLVLLGLLVISGAPVLRKWASRRKWDREPLFQTEHKISARDEGIHFQMGRIESNLVWQYYQRILESPDGFLLIYGDDAFNYLPKRAFANEEMINNFRALASKKLNQHREQ